jgi:bifunctional non-homologous end joining protein LigD
VRVWVDSVAGLLGLLEMDVVEVHPWAVTVDDIEHPDLLGFDLDPGPGVAWEFVIDSALRLRKLLQDEGLESWPKTTGGKGLHLIVPIGRDISHAAARLYCKRLAQRLEATDPARYTTSSAPARRNKPLSPSFGRSTAGPFKVVRKER